MWLQLCSQWVDVAEQVTARTLKGGTLQKQTTKAANHSVGSEDNSPVLFSSGSPIPQQEEKPCATPGISLALSPRLSSLSLISVLVCPPLREAKIIEPRPLEIAL